MSKRPTPETDAELHGINAVCKEDRKLDAMTSHARKLERERDEVREALMEIEDRCVDCEDACGDIQKIRDIAAKALEEPK